MFLMSKFNRLLIVALVIWCACSLYSANTDCDKNTERIEADSFLANMPDKLQECQTETIRKAIAGDDDLLFNVRNARNLAAELPIGVTRTDIGNNLTFFRSDRYDNDTIPLLVYFHGGGWVIGSVNSCSRYCAAMAEKVRKSSRFPTSKKGECIHTDTSSFFSYKLYTLYVNYSRTITLYFGTKIFMIVQPIK